MDCVEHAYDLFSSDNSLQRKTFKVAYFIYNAIGPHFCRKMNK